MIFTILSLIGGLVFLTLGAEGLIRGAVALAQRYGLSPLLIGITIMGFGTSTPELMASIQAAWNGNSGIAVGNVVGSNIFNILVILGFTALVRKTAIAKAAWQQSGMVMFAITVMALVTFTYLPTMPRWVGAMWVLMLATYLAWEYWLHTRPHKKGEVEAEPELPDVKNMPLWASIVLILLGLVGLMFGANLLVDGAVTMARTWGVSDAVIGLTIVAAGTSLPELAASVMAAMKKQPEMAVGNIIGSNIFNLLGILGITSMLLPTPIPNQIVNFDMWIMFGAALAFMVYARAGWRLTRAEGGLFVVAYLMYLIYLVQHAEPEGATATTLLQIMPFVG
jgi:cation:H+ antiporter